MTGSSFEPSPEIAVNFKTMVLEECELHRIPLSHKIRWKLKEGFSVPQPSGAPWADVNAPIASFRSAKIVTINERDGVSEVCTIDELVSDMVLVRLKEAISEVFSYPGRYSCSLPNVRPWDSHELYGWIQENVPATSLAEAISEHIVDPLLARPVMSLFVREQNEHGFFLHDPSDETDEYWRKRQENRIDLGDDVHLIVWKHRDLTDYMDVCFVYHVAGFVKRSDGERLGYISGYVLKSVVDRLSRSDFFAVCDDIDQTLADMAEALLKRRTCITSTLGKGSLFYLHQWEVADSIRGNGDGRKYLEAFISVLKRSHRGLNTLAVEFHPTRFEESILATAPPDVMADYEEASRKLEKYWKKITPHKWLGTGAKTVSFRAGPPKSPLEDALSVVGHLGLPLFNDLEGDV
jgi:GNAT superfamily N-acetyltransferase